MSNVRQHKHPPHTSKMQQPLSTHQPSTATSVIVYAKNMASVSRFYQDTLQLEVIEAELTYILLSRSGVEVVVAQAPNAVAEHTAISSPPELRESTPVKASFVVQDFGQVRAAAERSGGTLKPEEAAWQWRGAVHLDGNDPEGNVVQFRKNV